MTESRNQSSDGFMPSEPGVAENSKAADLTGTVQPVDTRTVNPQQTPPAYESIYIPSTKSSAGYFLSDSYGASPIDSKAIAFCQPPPTEKTQSGRNASVSMVLACISFWLCGFVFGLVAFLLELRAGEKLATGGVDGRKEARKLRRTSLVVSVVGIVVGVTVIVATAAALSAEKSASDDAEWSFTDSWYPWSVSKPFTNPWYSSSVSEYDECRRNQPVTSFQTTTTPSPEDRLKITLRINPASGCQPTISSQGTVLCNSGYRDFPLMQQYRYFIKGKCFTNRNSGSCLSCVALNGTFSNGFCYTKSYYQSYCSGYSVGGECYISRTDSADGKCPAGQIYYSGNCYSTPIPDCNGGYFLDCTCYQKKTRIFTSSTCINIGGYYVSDKSYAYYLPNGTSILADTNTCYYNSFDCPSYVLNGQCYSTVTTDYTAGTCRQIGGYMDTTTCSCYNNGFECRYPLEGIQQMHCFVKSIETASCTSCLNIGGYPMDACMSRYSDGDEYYYPDRPKALRCYLHNNFTYDNGSLSSCPYYSINTTRGPLCETHRTTAFSESECADKDGTYIDNRCYYTPTECEDFLYNCTCYKYRSTAYDNDDCTNIGGTFDFRRNVCYYNSAMCLYYTFNGKCYRNRNTYTQAEYCRGVYDSFYGYCYANN